MKSVFQIKEVFVKNILKSNSPWPMFGVVFAFSVVIAAIIALPFCNVFSVFILFWCLVGFVAAVIATITRI